MTAIDHSASSNSTRSTERCTRRPLSGRPVAVHQSSRLTGLVHYFSEDPIDDSSIRVNQGVCQPYARGTFGAECPPQ